MELFLIRHGIAEPRHARREDAERPLTQRGWKRVAEIAAGLDALGLHFDRLYASPWRRAAQTADALDRLLDGERIDTALLARAPRRPLLELLEGDRVALVGHQPWLSALLGWLTVGQPEAGAAFPLKKGGVAWLEGAPRPGQMVLRAQLPPSMLRALGRKR